MRLKRNISLTSSKMSDLCLRLQITQSRDASSTSTPGTSSLWRGFTALTRYRGTFSLLGSSSPRWANQALRRLPYSDHRLTSSSKPQSILSFSSFTYYYGRFSFCKLQITAVGKEWRGGQNTTFLCRDQCVFMPDPPAVMQPLNRSVQFNCST